MTQDEIIRMAHQAGFESFGNGDWVCFTEEIERLAAMVAAAEREECAKVAERMLRYYTQAVTGVPEAIRARGKE